MDNNDKNVQILLLVLIDNISLLHNLEFLNSYYSIKFINLKLASLYSLSAKCFFLSQISMRRLKARKILSFTSHLF